MTPLVDPVQYGGLIAKVDNLETTVTDLQKDVKSLLELANKSRGGFWAGMAIASAFGGAASWVIAHAKFT